MRKNNLLLYIAILFIITAIILLRLDPNRTVTIEKCDYDSDIRSYVAKTQEECSRTQVLCVPGRKFFSDECGCGCELIENKTEERTFCLDQDRNVDACIEIYQPVCGWNDPEKIKCIKYPCAQTYSNSCFACQDENVLYWTESECPEG